MRPWVFSSVLSVALGVGGCGAEAGLQLSAPEAEQALARHELTLIDIRTPQEWRETGIAAGAIPITMHQDEQAFVAAVLRAVNGNRDAPLGLICRTGNRSAFIQQVLRNAGFTRVYDISEGMAGSRAGPGWVRRGLPVVPCPPC